MPFKSRKQQDFLRINEPEIYDRWMRLYGPYEADSESWQGISLAGKVDEISEMLGTRKKKAEGDPSWMKNPEEKRKVFLKLQKQDGVPRICEVCEDAYTGLYYYTEDNETFVVCRPCVQQGEQDWSELFGVKPDWTGERGGRTRNLVMRSDYDYVPKADCSNCGKPADFAVYSLPVGSRYFCQERCYSDYVGLPPEPEGYYGYTAEDEPEWVVSSEDIQIGDKVRSYDFCFGGKTLQLDSYVEGYVLQIAPVEWCSPTCNHYHIRTTARLMGGKVQEDYEDYYFPVADANQTVVRRLRSMNAEDTPKRIFSLSNLCCSRCGRYSFCKETFKCLREDCDYEEEPRERVSNVITLKGKVVDKGHGTITGFEENDLWDVHDSENWGGDPEGQLAKALAKAREDSKKPRRPLKITKLPHRDQKTLKDFEAETEKEVAFEMTRKDIALVSFGAILGVISGVVGEVLAEFWLDRYRRDPELVVSEEKQNA